MTNKILKKYNKLISLYLLNKLIRLTKLIKLILIKVLFKIQTNYYINKVFKNKIKEKTL
jgi:Ni,Fe-hydrogenase I cytochrome b subunit